MLKLHSSAKFLDLSYQSQQHTHNISRVPYTTMTLFLLVERSRYLKKNNVISRVETLLWYDYTGRTVIRSMSSLNKTKNN